MAQKNMEILDRMPFLAKNAVFKKLAEIADVNTLTQEEHAKYDSSIKVLRDNIVVYEGAMQKGREEGRAEAKTEIIKQLLASGMSVEQVASVLRMTVKELEKLVKEAP